MRIITISRQFGSGGRELGKRLADVLGWDYYDKEIIQRLAEENNLDADYVSHMLNNHEWQNIPLTYQNSFSGPVVSLPVSTSLLRGQRDIIEGIAKTGNDCIIVGRDADIILSDYSPFKIFVCAEMEARVSRCMKHENKKPEDERLSEKQIEHNIKRIDKGRSQVREMLTGKSWGDSSAYNITVNTAEWSIKDLVPAVADFAVKWFEHNEQREK